MRTTQQFSITLPNEMADLVKAKVAQGEYATESEVIRDGLRALMARDRDAALAFIRALLARVAAPLTTSYGKLVVNLMPPEAPPVA